MALFSRRRERPPAELLARFERSERFLSWADVEGGVVAATSHGLWWPFAEGWRRVAWQHVDKVTWRDDRLMLVEADVVDDLLLVDRAPVVVRVTTPRDLPPVIRKRVEMNIAKTELLSIAGGAVRFVARRRPGQDGLAWWARLEPGTPDTEQVRSAVRARLAILRAGAAAS